MTELFHGHLCIRAITEEAWADQPEPVARVLAATNEARLVICGQRPDGVELHPSDLREAERIVDNPAVNREAAEQIIDLDPAIANCPPRLTSARR
jgi:hypothetical protein